MKTVNLVPVSASGALPDRWRADAGSRLLPDEEVLAWLELDLDARLRFDHGVVLLTDRRLLARGPGEIEFAEWPLRGGLELQLHDHAGAGALELFEGGRRLGAWRYTLGRNPAAQRLAQRAGTERLLANRARWRPV